METWIHHFKNPTTWMPAAKLGSPISRGDHHMQLFTHWLPNNQVSQSAGSLRSMHVRFSSTTFRAVSPRACCEFSEVMSKSPIFRRTTCVIMYSVHWSGSYCDRWQVQVQPGAPMCQECSCRNLAVPPDLYGGRPCMVDAWGLFVQPPSFKDFFSGVLGCKMDSMGVHGNPPSPISPIFLGVKDVIAPFAHLDITSHFPH